MRTSDRPSPAPLAVPVSRASVWKRGQNGLKFQNISGEVSLETVLHFRQVRVLELRVALPLRYRVGSPVPTTANMGCLGCVAGPLRLLKSAPYLTKLQNANFSFFKKNLLYVHN